MSRFAALAPLTDLAAWTGAYPNAAHVTIVWESLDRPDLPAEHIGQTFVAETVADVVAHLTESGHFAEEGTTERSRVRVFRGDVHRVEVTYGRWVA